MIVEHLISFGVVIFVQLALFVFHTWTVGELRNLPRYLVQGCVLGLPFGVAVDLVFGHQLGMWSYELGFPLWFLSINGIFSYGFMIANVILLYNHSLWHMIGWVIGVASVYEITNHYFQVWNWEYLPFGFLQLMILLALYILFTWGIMVVLRIVFGIRFRLVPF